MVKAVNLDTVERPDRPGPPRELVEAARDGDAVSLKLLVASCEKRLFRFCFYLSPNREQAEELAQEVFIRALGSLQKLKDGSKFLPWLFGIARNLLTDQRRVKRMNLAVTPLEDLKLESPAGESVHLMEEVMDFKRGLQELSPEDQVILVLAEVEGRTYEEIAEFMQLTLPGARSRLSRARQKFLKRG